MKNKNASYTKKEKGFTLVELMVVIMIIGLLIAIVIPSLDEIKKRGAISACECSLRGIQSSLELYYTHYKCYPDKLQALILEGYLDENSDTDTWGRKFMYQAMYSGEGEEGSSGSSQNAGNYLLGSDGPDGKKGSEDDIEPPINTSRHSPKNAEHDTKNAGDGGGN